MEQSGATRFEADPVLLLSLQSGAAPCGLPAVQSSLPGASLQGRSPLPLPSGSSGAFPAEAPLARIVAVMNSLFRPRAVMRKDPSGSGRKCRCR
jgi:hypothetical protein